MKFGAYLVQECECLPTVASPGEVYFDPGSGRYPICSLGSDRASASLGSILHTSLRECGHHCHLSVFSHPGIHHCSND